MFFAAALVKGKSIASFIRHYCCFYSEGIT